MSVHSPPVVNVETVAENMNIPQNEILKNTWTESNRATRLVHELLERTVKPNEDISDIARLITELTTCGTQIAPPLANALLSEDEQIQTAAATMVLTHTSSFKNPLFDRETFHQATIIVRNFLKNATQSNQIWCCALLLFLDAPKELESTLQILSKDNNKRLRVYASAVLSTINAGDSELINTLYSGLNSDDPELVRISAQAFTKLKLHSAQSLEALVLCLNTSNPQSQWHILISIKQIGTDASSIACALIKFIEDSRHDSVVRGKAAETLGCITNGTDTAISFLQSFLLSRHSAVVQGAIIGLAATGTKSSTIVDQFASLLTSEDQAIRLSAAVGLGEMNLAAVNAVTNLVDCLEESLGPDLADAIMYALSAIGPAAVPVLLSRIHNSNLGYIGYATATIGLMNPDGVDVFFNYVKKNPHEIFLMMINSIARIFRSKIAPVVPLLASALDAKWDDDMAFCILYSIECAGNAGLPAIPALIRCLNSGSEAQSHRAENVLINLGDEAVPIINQAKKKIKSVEAARIDIVLSRIAGNPPLFARLEKIDNDKALWNFMYIADILLKHGPMGYGKISKLLLEQHNQHLLPVGNRLSGRTLAKDIKHLELLLKTTLTTRSEKKSGTLTNDGHCLLRETEGYLSAKYRNKYAMYKS